MNIIDDLRWRGLLADCTDLDALEQRLAQGPITLYCGFDPTADSLHVGNLVPLLALRRFQLQGHHPIALAGGATGMVGDPSGKSAERNLQSIEQVELNIASVKKQLSNLLEFDASKTPANNPARLVNNYDWTAPVSFLEFLRDIGKHISVNAMVAKDSVRSRMEDRDAGISYTEFSYMLLQGFDFYHLRKNFNCELQIGATDQWGNITVGTELTRKKMGATVWGLVFPLLTKADGSKYGKTATGTVWLDEDKTSNEAFVDFFVNAEDAKVGIYLRQLTLLSREEILDIEARHSADLSKRIAQWALAEQVTKMVRNENAFEKAQLKTALPAAARRIRRGELPQQVLTPEELTKLNGVLQNSYTLPTWTTDDPKNPITHPLYQVLPAIGLCSSKNEARRLIQSGGFYANFVQIKDPNKHVDTSELLFGQHFVAQSGSNNWAIVSGLAPAASNTAAFPTFPPPPAL